MSPYKAIAAARDMVIETVERDHFVQVVAPTIAQCFDHKNEDIREIAVGTVIGICKDARYGEQALVLERFDPDRYVRTTALGSLGWVMNKVDPKLARKMAMHLYYVFTSPDEKQFSAVDKDASKSSILISMEVYYPEWGTVNFQEVWGKFLKKYDLPEKEFVKVEKK